MGKEHDSWLEGLGVNWFKTSDADASVVSGAGEMVKSAAKAAGHIGQAQFDGVKAAGAAILGGGAHVSAGILDAFGADETAGKIRKGANILQSHARGYADDAGRNLGKAKEDVFGKEGPEPEIDYVHGTGIDATTSFMKAEGSAQAGYQYNEQTGAEMLGVKASGKAAVAEVNADTPLGKVSGSFMKAEGSFQAGYEYDPESKVEFAGVKASGSVSVLDEKIQGKYGNVSGQLLSASASSKTGVEIDEKTGKIFIGTANSAEAKVAEIAGTLQTADGSAQLTGGVQVLKASAAADANMVLDKYGFDVNAKLGAEANLVKGEVGGEVRYTPKALFDNTIGWMTDTTAPDFLDFGPVLGAKVSAGVGVGGTVEAGGRLGVDEVNVRGGGFIELEGGLGLDLKAGFRLGPLKTAYDNQDAIIQTASDWGNAAVDAAGGVASGVASGVSDVASRAGSAGASIAGGAYNVAAGVAGGAYNVASHVASGVSNVASGVGNTVSNVASAVAGGVSNVASGVAGTVSNVASDVGGAVSNVGSSIADAASSTWDSLFS